MIVVELVRWGAFFVIWMTLWRLVQTKLIAQDSAIGKGMAFVA